MFFFSINLQPLKNNQLLTSHRLPSTVNRDPLQGDTEAGVAVLPPHRRGQYYPLGLPPPPAFAAPLSLPHSLSSSLAISIFLSLPLYLYRPLSPPLPLPLPLSLSLSHPPLNGAALPPLDTEAGEYPGGCCVIRRGIGGSLRRARPVQFGSSGVGRWLQVSGRIPRWVLQYWTAPSSERRATLLSRFAF